MPTRLDENGLTKGQLRKLNALRKSLGPEIADKAFAQWMKASGAGDEAYEDKNIEILSNVILHAVEQYGLTFPRGGYVVRRGRGRVIVTPAA